MSKNRLRGITLVRGPIWGIHSLTLIISCFDSKTLQFVIYLWIRWFLFPSKWKILPWVYSVFLSQSVSAAVSIPLLSVWLIFLYPALVSTHQWSAPDLWTLILNLTCTVLIFFTIIIPATCIWFNKKKKSGRDKYVAKHNAGLYDLIGKQTCLQIDCKM